MRVIILVVICLLVAGCLGPRDTVVGRVNEASAEEVYPFALRDTYEGFEMPGFGAHEVNGTLRPAAVFALESRGWDPDVHVLMDGNTVRANWTKDRVLGDGLVPTWQFLFRDDGKTVWSKTVSAREGDYGGSFGSYPSSKGYLALGSPDRTFETWAVDSDEAARIATDDGSWRSAVAEAETVAMILHVPDGQDGPFWLLGAHDVDRVPLAHVLVDATSGEMRDLWSVYQPAVKTFEHTVQLTPVAKKEIATMDGPEASGAVLLKLSLPVADPLSAVTYTVSHRLNAVAEGVLTPDAPEAMAVFALGGGEPFGLALHQTEGAVADVKVEWCLIDAPWQPVLGLPDDVCP